MKGLGLSNIDNIHTIHNNTQQFYPDMSIPSRHVYCDQKCKFFAHGSRKVPVLLSDLCVDPQGNLLVTFISDCKAGFNAKYLPFIHVPRVAVLTPMGSSRCVSDKREYSFTRKQNKISWIFLFTTHGRILSMSAGMQDMVVGLHIYIYLQNVCLSIHMSTTRTISRLNRHWMKHNNKQ